MRLRIGRFRRIYVAAGGVVVVAMGAAALSVVAPSAVAAAPTAPQIYIADFLSGDIDAANLDGTGFSSGDFITGASFPEGVAVDGQHIYWANSETGSIGRANLDGSDVDQDFITGADDPEGVAVDRQHVYWANDGDGTIGRANLDGSGVDQNFITGGADPFGVAVDGQHIYWANNGDETIGRANLDGTGVNQNFITGGDEPVGPVVDGQHIYWAKPNTIGRANLDGTGVNQNFITGADDPVGVAVDGEHVYWANLGNGSIGRANLDGTGVNQSFITTGLGSLDLLALSVPVAQVTPAAPSAFAATVPGRVSPPQTLTISNSGQRDLSIDGVSLAGQDPGDFIVDSNGCTGSVAPGASCQLTVRFSPAAAGARKATLDIATSDFANSPLQVPLSGTGQAPPPPPNTTPVTTTPPPLTTVPGGGQGGQGGATASVPALSDLRVSPKMVHVSGRKTKGGKCVKQTKKNKTRPVCTRKAKLTVAFTLSTAASVKFKLTGKVPGRRAGKRCVAQTRHNARAKECARLVTMKGMAARQGKVGANRFTLSRKLAPGVYTLTAAPVGGAAKKATYKVTN